MERTGTNNNIGNILHFKNKKININNQDDLFLNESFLNMKTNLIKENDWNNNLYIDLIKKYSSDQKSEHEITRQYISEKIEKLSSELAKKDELLKSKHEILLKIEDEFQQNKLALENEVNNLKNHLVKYLPHKRSFKTSLYFVILFLSFIFSELFFNVKIMETFWATLGVSVSFGFLIMSYFLFIDWKNRDRNGSGYK